MSGKSVALRWNKAKVGAALLTIFLLFYLVLTFQRGWLLLTTGGWVAHVMGAALLVLPIIGVWALVRELLFGAAMERLAGVLEAEGGLPPDDLPRTPGGRIVRSAADEAFGRYRHEAEAAPDDWRSWFRLSCAYDVSGDRRRARSTMRYAISMEKRERA
ncbi:hypothetical protein [Spelaeicoccus albus]|uniref:Tetratricopeptide repeat protein n=1 Tax=Spelaeicoccus albus TaxID=1280376 RepID=A0A7Z0D2R5_9MICO|nr:hypothetical protein [Spelaeicoccus albus]NYI67809.1 hypothetical protein [Spelaeicoccus albus]